MNITQLEKEIVRVLKINENVDWDFSDIPPKEEFKELQIFIKRLFKEYRGQEWHNEMKDTTIEIVRTRL